MRLLSIGLVLFALACDRPSTTPRRPEPAVEQVTGGCRYERRQATCTLLGIDALDVDGARNTTVSWSANVEEARCTSQFTVDLDVYDAFTAHVADRGEIPCFVEVESGGSCPPVGACELALPPFDGARWTGGSGLVSP